MPYPYGAKDTGDSDTDTDTDSDSEASDDEVPLVERTWRDGEGGSSEGNEVVLCDTYVYINIYIYTYLYIYIYMYIYIFTSLCIYQK